MVEVRKLERVAQEEHRRVVADHVPVAFLGIELHREASNVTLGVSGAALARHDGEAGEQIRLLAHFGEDLGAGETGDVMRDRERAIGTRPLGMHAPLGNHFTVEMGELLQEPDVLQQLRPPGAGRQNILVVDNRAAGVGGQSFVFQEMPPWCAVKKGGESGGASRRSRSQASLREPALHRVLSPWQVRVPLRRSTPTRR